jgi:SNF2 family DNA or RNA helicase
VQSGGERAARTLALAVESSVEIAVDRAAQGVPYAVALRSPFRSGITIEDHQLDPVVRALSMPRANLLIADDVGLGKTIEAGLVIRELLLRR